MSDNLSKKARRDAARDRARVAREKEKARRRRNRIALWSGVIVAALAVVTVVTVVIATSTGPAGPGPKNMASDGILLKGDGTSISAVTTAAIKSGGTPTATKQDNTAGIANITIYEDYMCPYCNQFETANMSQIKSWVKAGSATLEIHPFNLLDASSLGTKYSSRAANAAACVANYEPNEFLNVNTAFYKNQPSEQTKGLTDDQIVKLVQKAGATNKQIPSCITSGKFRPWVAASTNRVLNDKIPNSTLSKVTGTPTVIVNGKQFDADSSVSLTDASGFASFVESTVASTAKSGSTSTGSATPSASASS
jgi:protein-disulfide isomerase